MGGLSLPLIGRSVCSKKLVEDCWDVHSSCVKVEGRVINSNMSGFSGNLLAVLVFYLEVGDFGFRMVVGNAVFVNCTGNMGIVFLNVFSKHLLDSPM